MAIADKEYEKKPKLTKEERRLLQEAQRAAKAGGAAKPPAKTAAAPSAPPSTRLQVEIYFKLVSLVQEYDKLCVFVMFQV